MHWAVAVALLGCAITFPLVSRADEPAEALAEAKVIVSLLSQGGYKDIWEHHAGDVLKKASNENDFLSYTALGRSNLAPLTNSSVINVDYTNFDPVTKFSGHIYAVTFLDVYGPAQFYERIVVYRDPAGRFKLGGLSGAPVPQK